MEKARSKYRILSLIMTVLILIMSLPTYAFATLIDDAIEGSNTSVLEDDIETSFSKSEVLVLEEDVSLRDENIKHFKLSDGTTKAVAYATPVHYKDSEGNWIDIDNSLSLNGSEYTAKNKSEIKFANKSGSNGLVSIKDGEYKIDFTPLNTNKVSVEIENPQGNNSRKFDDIKKLTNLISKATYKNIYDGIDLEYILIGNNIKENIIVNEKQDTYSYSFEIKLNKLKAELVENSIILSDYDTDEQIYEIPAPYMLDNNGAYSSDVEYSLVQNNKWKYTLTVTANANWINSDERAFPVTIDPTVESGTPTKEIFVMEGDGVEDSLPYLIVGNFMGFYYDIPAFIKFDNLSTIAEDAKLIDAKLSLHISYVENQTGNDFKIGVYPAKANWYSKNTNGQYPISYENLASYYDRTSLIDYLNISSTGVYSWDITKLYQNWLQGSVTNNGVCIKGIGLPTSNDTTVSNKRANVRVSTSTNTSNYMIPTIELTYSSIKGIEDRYTYYVSDTGMAGAGYINSYDGNLTFVSGITTTADEILPYSLSVVYDNSTATWRNSFDEGIVCINSSASAGERRYKWTDSDGTEHWFLPYQERDTNGNIRYYYINDTGGKIEIDSDEVDQYYDEDGLGLTLTKQSATYTISDQSGNQKVFTASGRLSHLIDTFGNKRTFYYTNDNLTEISLVPFGRSTTVTQLNLTYDSNNKLVSVYNNQTKVRATLNWTGGKIISIVYESLNDGVVTLDTVNYAYTFEESGDTRTPVFSAEDQKTQTKAIYYAVSGGNQIIGIEHTSEDNLASSYAIEYENTRTVFTDKGTDTTSTEDDILTVYVFDNKARVVSAYSCDSTETTIYGSNGYSYYDKYEEENVGPKIHNNVKNTFSTGTNAPNILSNPDFVYNTSTSKYTGWTVSGATPTQGTTFEEYVTPLNITHNSASTTKISQKVTNLSVGTYTFSAYLNKYGINESSKVRLKVLNSSSVVVASEIFLRYANESTSLSDYWEREELRFDISVQGIYTVVIEFESATSNEECLQIDNAMLEKGTGASTFSIYSNGAFGNGALTLSSTPTTTLQASKQVINLPQGTSLQGWVLSAWVKAEGCVPSANKDNCSATFAIKVKSDTFEEIIPLNTECEGWQYISVALSYDDSLTCPPYGELSVSLIYDYNNGNVDFDDISLCKLGSSTAYDYNALGNVKTVTNSNSKVTYNYDGGNLIDVTSVEESGITKSTASYDNNHNLTSVGVNSSSGILSSTVERNSQGQVTKSISTASSKQMVIDTTFITDTTSATYSYVDTTTDERGNVTKYYYTENGLLKGVCLNDDNGTLYDYNAYGELIKISLAKYNSTTSTLEYATTSNNDSIDYEYNSKSELTGILTDTLKYEFIYDQYGNLKSVLICDDEYVNSVFTALASYDYEENNGNLETLTYGNGVKVQYLYDNLDRLVGVCYNENTEESIIYTYGSNGLVSSAYDVDNSTVYDYYYDGNGSITREKAIKNGTTLYERVYSYNDKGNLTSVNLYCLDENTNPINGVSYTYDDYDRLSSIRNSNGERITYTYDAFGRVTNKQSVISIGFQKQYTYTQGRNSSETTGLIKSEVTKKDSSTISTKNYTYDDRGNITKITTSDGHTITYGYDDKNQLIGENNTKLGIYVTYEYDNGGNIIKKTTIDTTTGTQTVNNYGYNAVWEDLLVSYNGQTISYDSVGNPLSYYNGTRYTFTWEEGRQLASSTIGSNTYTYKYNQDGIRIEKNVGTLKYEYTLNGTQIIREKVTNGATLLKDSYFYYDASGLVSSAKVIVHSGTTSTQYNLVFDTNIQGDVVGIYLPIGTNIVTFEYDAWGNFRATYNNETDTTLQSIAGATPFRYRGYQYDAETGLYYLNSRYYDAKIGRFINADSYVSTGQGLNGYNMFAYCNNNPVMCVDNNGTFALIVTVIILATTITAAVTFLSSSLEEKPNEVIYEDVPLYDQGDTNLCWAYSQIMVEDYKNGIVRTEEEASEKAQELGKEIFGKNWNRPFFPRYMWFGFKPDSITDVRDALLRNKAPLYAYYKNGEGGHYVVVTGVDVEKNLVYTNNPWGTQGVQTFEEFQNSVVGHNGNVQYELIRIHGNF